MVSVSFRAFYSLCNSKGCLGQWCLKAFFSVASGRGKPTRVAQGSSLRDDKRRIREKPLSSSSVILVVFFSVSSKQPNLGARCPPRVPHSRCSALRFEGSR
eukprot:6444063-Amphidinium_carterae.1